MATRRKAIGILGAGMAAAMTARPAMPADKSADKEEPRLAALRAGDSVGLIAPASSNDNPYNLEVAMQNIRGMGLVPKPGRHVADQYGYLSGTDANRAADINRMFADDDIKALFAIRGGWGSARLLPLLDWDMIRRHPKLIIGSSDITALHLAMAAKTDIPGIHGPNAVNRWDTISWTTFWQQVFAGQTPLLAQPDDKDPLSDRWQITTIRPGKAQGRLIGGNLTVLSTLMGTPWLPDFSGAILFLEDVGEAEYRIDRMLNQLALAGILDKLAGIVFGQCARCSSSYPDYAGFTLPQILSHYFAPLRIPVFSGANIGHVSNQLCLPVGAHVEMDAGAGTIRLTKPIATLPT